MLKGTIMKISVCIIVKNESETVERCLESVKPFADEIIVVDTGSVDDTKAKARKFTDKIYDFKWINDFSAARNHAIEKATSDYLFWLDADDVIDTESALKIAALKTEKNIYDTYMFRYAVAFDKNGLPTFEYYRERLMKNCAAARFKGFVHEAVAPFGKIVYRDDITIEHRKIKSGDPTRNLRMYEEYIASGKTLDARGEYYYAKELFYNRRYADAKRGLQKYLSDGAGFLPDVKDAYKTIYKCDALRCLSADEKNLTDALAACGADSEIFCYLGDARLRRGDFTCATAYYKCALCVDKPSPESGFYESKFYYIEPLLRLVSAYYDSGDKKTAAVFHDLCLKNYPEADEVVFNSRFFEK